MISYPKIQFTVNVIMKLINCYLWSIIPVAIILNSTLDAKQSVSSMTNRKHQSRSSIISDKPEKFNVKNKGEVILKELANDSQRRLIKVTQEELIIKFVNTFLPDININELTKRPK